VLWIRAGRIELALVVSSACNVRKADPLDASIPHVAACLEGKPNAQSRYVVDVDLGWERGADRLAIGVDEVAAIERVLLRPLTPLLSTLGPYAGVVLRGDGSLRLAIDPFRLAPRLRAMGVDSRRGNSAQ
jgi:chemotaxis protein histidine kinase CheA